MSDKNQDEIELDFDIASDKQQEAAESVEVSDSESFDSYESVTENYEDIDDGDDDGIFAPEYTKQKSGKSASLLGAVALLAVAGAGGYVYYSNPQMIEQVKENLLGSGASVAVEEGQPETVSDVETAVAESAVEQQVEEQVEPQVLSGEASVVPADGVDVTNVAETAKSMDEAAQQEVVEMPSDVMPPKDEGAGVENASPVVETKTLDMTPSSEAPVAETPVVETPVVETPVVEAPVVEAPATETAVAETQAPELTEKPPVSEKAEAVVAVEPEKLEQKTEPKTELFSEEKAPEKVAEKPVIVESKEAQKAAADAKLDKYFDSPSGKIIANMPAPSLNPKKGKNESIIIVNKSPQKTKSSQKAKVSIQTTTLESKMVAADRALMLNRYDAAKDMLDELYRINPRDGRVLMSRAVLFQKTGQTEQAISAYEEVLKYNPDNAEAVVNLAGLIRKQYPAVALGKLLDLRQQYPNNPVVAAQLGVAYADSGNFSDAFHYLSMAASMEPNNPQHYFNMAVVSEKARNPQKAVQYYEKALEVEAVSGAGSGKISRELIYDRLARLRGN